MTISEIRGIVIDCDKPNPARLMVRISACLAAYFDPDNDPEVKLMVRKQYAQALSPYPSWAVARAFDEWAKSGTRRPSPADLVILVERNIAPYFAELSRREALAQQERDEREAANRRRATPEQREAILREFGMTDDRMQAVKRFPKAATMDEAVAMQAEQAEAPARHWSDTAAPDGPEWAALRAARAQNPLMNGRNEL